MDEKLKQAIALGREHYEKREYEKAERYLSQATTGVHRFADIHNMRGVIHHDRGELEAAREWQYRLLPLMDANFLETNPTPVKAALAAMGRIQNVLRLPLVPASPATEAALAAALEPFAPARPRG